MTRAAFVLGLVAALGCKADTDDSTPGPTAGSGSGSASGSAKGTFGADLAADLAGSGSGSGSAAAVPVPAAATGSAVAASGSAAAASGSAAAASGSAAAASGSGSAAPAAASGSAVPASGSGPAAAAPLPIPATPPPTSGAPRVPAKVPPDIAAIKLSLQPNWDRDIGDPATISLVVKRPTGEPAVFTFAYGYDDPKAPADRDAYVKYLADAKTLTVTLNRQKGAAWYLEGTDATGAPSFRFLVNYGGKHLICGGSLYKDAASSSMGDIRDEVINQAKKICETLAL